MERSESNIEQEKKEIKAPGITDAAVKEAMARCEKYRQHQATMDLRLKENEKYYELQYKNTVNVKEQGVLPERGSAYLFNAIFNKVADLMDNYPQPNILPREKSDENTAKIFSEILPVILKRNNYKKTYHDCMLEKVKNGFAITGVFWNPVKDGIGEVEIRRIDPLNIRWEPGIDDIQDSKEVFVLSEIENEVLREMYPEQLGDYTGGPEDALEHYQNEGEDRTGRSEKSVVYDWYYKKTVMKNVDGQLFPKKILHYCKFCGGKVLYSSENAGLEDGWYEDGMYPFVFDVMYPIKAAPHGFGYIDIMQRPQKVIDWLDKAICESAAYNSTPRFVIKNNAGLNEDDFADMTKRVIKINGNPQDNIMQQQPTYLPGVYVQVLENKKEELKENTGNRDFSQGSTTGGVTAASAIAALQEASSKTSRTLVSLSYASYENLVAMIINRMQQFYTIPRTYRVITDNETQYRTVGAVASETMDNMTALRPDAMIGDLGTVVGGRKPIYDIDVSAERANPYSRIANNELAKELLSMGAFNPELADQMIPALEIMDFDKKEEVLEYVKKNKTMLDIIKQQQAMLQGIAPIIAETTGNTRLMEMLGTMPADTERNRSVRIPNKNVDVDTNGNAEIYNDNSEATQMRKKVRGSTNPEVGKDEY